eukprot:TRINITY_DN27359_c0_g1_i1.p1 TRINITY_DN27359_c0_g1~~TRINITY_DN27359_c0_g1_i1.p1  ORF type:complete len:282 (+),score=33.46 TRINITY_DN27359_c0_g1_i1:13-858(+)
MAAPVDQFRELLDAEVSVDLGKLIDIAKHGIPGKVRGEVWEYLLEVSKPDKSEEMKQDRKHTQDYMEIDKSSTDVRKSVQHHLKRYNPKMAFFHSPAIQQRFENIMCSHHNYDGGSDVSSIGGLVAMLGPFVYCMKKESQQFWCFQAFMKKRARHFDADSINRQLSRFMMCFRSILPELFNHFEEEELSPKHYIVDWLKYLLAPNLRLECIMRLWDTYFSIPNGFDLHIYVCIAILSHCSEALMELEMFELKLFLQHLPMIDMDEIISKAHNIRLEVINET